MKKDKKKFGFKTIINEFLNAFNVEKGMFPTVRDLLIRPDAVINHYIEGKQLLKIYKEKYFLPGRFFVTVFFIIGIFSFFFGENILNPTNLDSSTGYFDYEGKMLDLYTATGDFINRYIMLVVVITGVIPYAIGAKLIFIKRKEYTIAMHFVMSVYFQCLILLATPILLLFASTQEQYLTSVMIVYALYYTYAFKRIFNLTFGMAILNGVILMQIISLLVIILIGICIGILYAAMIDFEILPSYLQ